jgi:peptidoglycan/LPS O-acetylase OafA/YrhL
MAPQPSTNEPGRQLDRLEGWDALRGVAITFVVLIHAAGPLEPDTYRDDVVGGLARLGVPLFVLLSGTLAGFRATSRERHASYFAKFVRLHLLYGVFYALFHVSWGGELHFTLESIASRFSGTGWPGQYYFLILIQLYCLAALVVPTRLWSRGWVVIACACIGAIALAICFGVREGWLFGSWPASARMLLGNKMIVWFWLYEFAIGAWVGARMRRGAVWTPSILAGSALVALAVAIATFGVPLPGDAADPRHYAYQRPRIDLAITLVALALPTIARGRFGRWLPALGRDSFGIFVLNPAVLALLFGALGAPDRPVASLLFAGATLVICLPLARRMRLHLPWVYA